MEKYDIYDIEFIYEEDKLKENPRTKIRPVLVLGNDIFVPVAKITGTNSRTPKTYEIMEWEQAGLTKPSYIIFDRMELQSRRALTPEKYRGHLSDKDIQKIKSLRLGESLKKHKTNESLKSSDYKETTTGDIVSDSFGNISDEEIDDLMKLYKRLALKLGLRKSESDNVTVIITPDEYEIDEIKESAEKVDSISTKFSTIDIYEKDGIRFGVENIHYNSFVYFKNEKDKEKII